MMIISQKKQLFNISKYFSFIVVFDVDNKHVMKEIFSAFTQDNSKNHKIYVDRIIYVTGFFIICFQSLAIE